jgi:hypothetical protein
MYGRRMPPGFVGLSIEYSALRGYTGKDPLHPNPVLIQLIRNLAPGQSPVIRIGGDSADRTWAPTHKLRKPPGVRFSITNGWLASTRALAQATNARMIFDINFEADSRKLAQVEARALVRGIGAAHIAALELGNEPELYGSFGWYQTADRQPVPGRPPGYDLRTYERDFAHIASGLPHLPLAGPAIGGQQWIHYTGRFVTAEPRLQMVTVHRYPLQRCLLPAISPAYPTIPHLLDSTSMRGIADGIAQYAAIAHSRGLPFRVDELNSVSCGGAIGVSNVFASALWSLNTLFELARAGVDGVNVHTFGHAIYAPFRFTHIDHVWRALVQPEYYGLLMFAQADPTGARLLRIASRIPNATQEWATRSSTGTINVVLINDGRRHRTIDVRAPGAPDDGTLERLTAPSLAATRHIDIGGQTFGAATTTGSLAGRRKTPELRPRGGAFAVTLPAASAALLTLPKG